MHKILYISLFLPFCVLISFCKNERPKEKGNSGSFSISEADQEGIKKQFMKANAQLSQKEVDEMDYYEKTHKLPFVKTASGLRFNVYKPSARGDSIRADDTITMDYTVKLLDGTECYSSRKEGPKTFIVAHDDLESGIQKGVQYLKRGDKAIFLIP